MADPRTEKRRAFIINSVYFCLIASMQEISRAAALLEYRLQLMEEPDIRFTYYRDHYDETIWYLEIFDREC